MVGSGGRCGGGQGVGVVGVKGVGDGGDQGVGVVGVRGVGVVGQGCLG